MNIIIPAAAAQAGALQINTPGCQAIRIDQAHWQTVWQMSGIINGIVQDELKKRQVPLQVPAKSVDNAGRGFFLA